MICVDSFSRVINESSSKGNQHKFYKDGVWVKIDSRYCSEGLAEEFVSLFEDCIYDFPHVEYKSDKVVYNNLYSDELNKRIKEVLINRLRYYEGKAFIFN